MEYCGGKVFMEDVVGRGLTPIAKKLFEVLLFQKRSCRFKNMAVHAKSTSIIPGKILNTTINQKNESFTIASFAINYSPFSSFFPPLSTLASVFILMSEPLIT
jgi:hypothetical protein